MKEQIERLRELQELDLKLDTLKKEKREITDRLELNKSFLQKLISDLELQKERLEEIRVDLEEKKKEYHNVNESLALRKKRLSSVTNTKEYTSVEKEIDTQTKALEVVRAQIVTLVESITATEESISTKEGKIVQLRESIAMEVFGSKEEIEAFNKKIEELAKQEEAARAAVSKPVMYKYDFIRKRRHGQAIAAAKDGHCEGCYMALPPQEFIEIQRGQKLITCPSCQRILYFEPSDPPQDADFEEE